MVPGREQFHTLGSRMETQSLNNRFFRSLLYWLITRAGCLCNQPILQCIGLDSARTQQQVDTHTTSHTTHSTTPMRVSPHTPVCIWDNNKVEGSKEAPQKPAHCWNGQRTDEVRHGIMYIQHSNRTQQMRALRIDNFQRDPTDRLVGAAA